MLSPNRRGPETLMNQTKENKYLQQNRLKSKTFKWPLKLNN